MNEQVLMTHSDPFHEAERALDAAEAAEVDLRATGGVAVGLRCRSAHRPPLARAYGDVDFVAPRRQCESVEALFVQLGYEPEQEFNALHGDSRLFFYDRANAREADVFIDAVRGCHQLDVRDRIRAAPRTLAPADLLLSKLQIRDTHRKDHLDTFALLIDCELCDNDGGINRNRLAEVCCNDWGWWHTVTIMAARAEAVAPEIIGDAGDLSRVSGSLRQIRMFLDDAPKSRRWKLRAKVGDRVRWYESPEELEHQHAAASA
jgi:hypothetical protein